MKLKHISLIIMSLFFVISGCSIAETTDKEKNSNQEEEKNPKEKEKKTVEKIEYPVAATEPEEIVRQPIGIKMVGVYSDTNVNNVDPDFEHLMAGFGTEGLGSEEIFNGLVHWFGVDYSLAYETLAKYEPDFGELDLTKEKKKTKNIAIHIDSSGSMAAAVPGGEKMKLAKESVRNFGSSLPADAFISLRAYGHKGSGKNEEKAMSCSSTEMMYETNTFDETLFNEALNKFKPSGWTPLAAAIQSAYDDLKIKAGEETENILYIISDGVETCDGNPVEEAKKLAESDLQVKINIIGFDVDDAGQKQLKEAAAASNGNYYTVNTKIELENAFKKLMEEAASSIAKNQRRAVNGINVNFRTADLFQHLRGIESAFKKVVNLEKKLFEGALWMLEKDEKIENTAVNEIKEKLKERHDSLHDYAESLGDQGREKIDLKREELFRIIDES
ncbi:VWA domain-containing protein [Bacillus sp. FJAT-29790]|uniref:VWA domain-containing protein n=1 Tax=Bacillus sp. FJAT-29790 TaxID=1895002 RepID=UPI001C241F94|nr:VWA domain-containing protein [Bacillus sp. FJAT-29790]MBU8881359.1 VWA domain-containing protein [Bacillus sp. FJAT-29790]